MIGISVRLFPDAINHSSDIQVTVRPTPIFLTLARMRILQLLLLLLLRWHQLCLSVTRQQHFPWLLPLLLLQLLMMSYENRFFKRRYRPHFLLLHKHLCALLRWEVCTWRCWVSLKVPLLHQELYFYNLPAVSWLVRLAVLWGCLF